MEHACPHLPERYEFGIYWDSWAHIQQMEKHGGAIEKLGDRWHTRPIGGEAAYNWGTYRIQPGDSPTDTLRDPVHRKFLIDSIRRFHGNNLGWVSKYDPNDAVARTGAEEVQRAFGYRFVLDEVRYHRAVGSDRRLIVTLKVRNTGSSPFYYNWPVEVSLLDPKTRAVAWRDSFEDADIRTWLPGDRWDPRKQVYRAAPKTHRLVGNFQLPESVSRREYVLALAILDPAGLVPAARFAVKNYFEGGRHPMGKIGVGVIVKSPELDPGQFDDPAEDRTLHYKIDPPQGTQSP